LPSKVILYIAHTVGGLLKKALMPRQRQRNTFLSGLWRYNSLCETHRRATERHLPYGITQCFRPPDTSARQARTQFTNPGGM